MSDKWLEQATRALREQSADAEIAPQNSRQRVQRRLEDDRRSAARRVAIAVPLVAFLVGSTALAAATGQLPKVWRTVRQWVGTSAPQIHETAPVVEKGAADTKASRAIAKAAPKGAAVGPETAEAEPPAAPAAAALVDVVPPAVDKDIEKTNEIDTKHPHAGAGVRVFTSRMPKHDPTATAAAADKLVQIPVVAPVAPPALPAGPDVLALFRQAQKLHFDQKNWQLALVAWQAYLDAAPNGELAPEARWNRAVCLVRLHEKRKAIQALKPFALGPLGSYRQADALALLEELQDGAAADDDTPRFLP